MAFINFETIVQSKVRNGDDDDGYRVANLIARNSIESVQFEGLRSDKKKKETKRSKRQASDIDPDGLKVRKKEKEIIVFA